MEFKHFFAKYGLVYWKRYYSSYHGIVVNNQDPEMLGRLQISCPAVYGKNNPPAWAWPKGIPCGNGIGLYILPNKGDMIWVDFSEGDPKEPIWQYGWWRTGDMPPISPNPAQVNIDPSNPPATLQVWQSLNERVELDDANGLIRITQKNGRIIELNQQGISIGSKTKSSHPAVLGDINKNAIENLNDDLTSVVNNLITYCTAQIAITGSVTILAPLGAAYSVLLTALTDLVATIGQNYPVIDQTNSETVTLD